MEEKRSKTLEALSAFIQSQKTLLDQTLQDIARLQELRQNVVSNPDDALDLVTQQASSITPPFSTQPAIVASGAQEIEWSAFNGCDPSPLKDLASSLHEAQSERTRPSSKQTTPLSDLQQLVRDARIAIIDPVLPAYAFLNEPDSEPDEPPDPEEIRRALEREKIRELKRRRFDSDAVVPVVAGLRRPASASHGVFIRRDQADESAEVDISLDAEDQGGERAPSVFDGTGVPAMDVDTPPTSVASPMSTKAALPPSIDKPTRDRRPTKKANASTGSVRARGKGRQPNAAGPDDPAPAPGDAAEVPDAGKGSRNGKQMSQTYKQAWSVSEQHLLERLLEEIPEGTKNRWARISQAMGGRRTARQVASRVQKYFEKLKRFGVDVGSSTKNTT